MFHYTLTTTMQDHIIRFLNWIVLYFDPWIISLYFVGIGLMGPLLMTRFTHREDDKTIVVIGLAIKNLFVRILGLLAISTPFFLVGLAFVAGVFTEFTTIISNQSWDYFEDLWYLIFVLISLPAVVQFFILRIIKPRLSAYFRQLRFKQTGEELSDIRTLSGTLSSKTYNTESYFKDDAFFFGLDTQSEPVYVSDNDFAKAHIRVVGATQTGKGVQLGSLIKQAIIKNQCTLFLDQKPDDFIPDIMREACEQTGRRLIVVDLNGVGTGRYGPFQFGTKIERRERLFAATDLNDDGTNADFYRRGAREVFDEISHYWDGTIQHLWDLLHGKAELEGLDPTKKERYFTQTTNLRSALAEWKQHPPFNPKPGRGLNLQQSIDNNAVIYIRGAVKNKLIRKAMSTLIEEIIQIGLRRNPNQHQIYLTIDEVRFVVTESLADAMATLLSKRLNMTLAYQSISDLLSLPDGRMNAQSILNGIETNSRRALFYATDDPDTAEYIAKRSGTIQKSVTRSESVSVNQAGAEVWDNERTLNRVEEAYITENQAISFPERVGVLFQPNTLAQVIYTSWIPVKEFKGVFSVTPEIPSNPLVVPKKKARKPKSAKPKPKLQAKPIDSDVLKQAESLLSEQIKPKNDSARITDASKIDLGDT